MGTGKHGADDMDKVFKALADPSRRLILGHLVKNNGQTLNELCEHHDMARQSVSKHLAVLEEAKLILIERQGRNKKPAAVSGEKQSRSAAIFL